MRKYRKNSIRVKIWNAIRALNRFSIFDIQQIAASEYDNTKRYLRALELAGYLTCSGNNGRRKIYRMIRDTGPKAPIQVKYFQIYDPNTDENIRVVMR